MKHIVPEDERDRWEAYAHANKGWIQNSLDVQEKDEEWDKPIIRKFNASYKITDASGMPHSDPVPGRDGFLPMWQQAPMLTGPFNPLPYNRDMWTILRSLPSNANAMDRRRVTWGSTFWGIITDPTNTTEVINQKKYAAWAGLFLAPGEEVMEPNIQIQFPVVDSTEAVRIDVTKEPSVVAILTFTIYFRSFIQDVLPTSSNGILVVVENPCDNQVFTYQLDGPSTTYLGHGDWHDPKYDDMVYSASLSELMDTTKTERKSSYTGLPLDEEFCPKIIHIYPSRVMEDEHISNRPIIFTSLAAIIFIFTSLVFISYDWLVRRRQRIVMGRAVASSAIVSSLFPETVRDKLYEERQGQGQQAEAKKKFLATPESALPARPIADLYENVTVFFADISGFTKWSASRTPAEVFELLETVYSAFDKIAARRKVFKVET